MLRVLARVSEMPVQNSISKISACPDLATNLLQILIPNILRRPQYAQISTMNMYTLNNKA